MRQVILGSEGEFATQYVVWMRSLAGIGVLHWMLARASAADPSPAAKDAAGMAPGDLSRSRVPLFPNILP